MSDWSDTVSQLSLSQLSLLCSENERLRERYADVRPHAHCALNCVTNLYSCVCMAIGAGEDLDGSWHSKTHCGRGHLHDLIQHPRSQVVCIVAATSDLRPTIERMT
jgi:hypothetical protein